MFSHGYPSASDEFPWEHMEAYVFILSFLRYIAIKYDTELIKLILF